MTVSGCGQVAIGVKPHCGDQMNVLCQLRTEGQLALPGAPGRTCAAAVERTWSAGGQTPGIVFAEDREELAAVEVEKAEE